MIVYDDAGGNYDHVVPPFEGVPADDAPCRAPCADFDFRRLGPRVTALLMSPRVAKGSVVQEPRAGPTNTSQFEHSSVPATVNSLFNLSAFLTKRDAWAVRGIHLSKICCSGDSDNGRAGLVRRAVA